MRRNYFFLRIMHSCSSEFLLIGLKNQLAKIHNSSLDTSHSARTLASSLTNILLLLTKLLLSPKLVTITFVNFAVYSHTLIRQLPVPLLPLSFTPNLITVILSTINYLSLNYPVSSISRTLLLVLSWKFPSHVTSLLSYALFTGSGSLNASNTSSSRLPTKFSQLPLSLIHISEPTRPY